MLDRIGFKQSTHTRNRQHPESSLWRPSRTMTLVMWVSERVDTPSTTYGDRRRGNIRSALIRNFEPRNLSQCRTPYRKRSAWLTAYAVPVQLPLTIRE